jgi:VanZ family protein
MAVIFLLSSQEAFPAPRGVSAELLAILAHFLIFGFLSVLVLLAVNGVGPISSRAVVIAVALTTLYGISDEIHQSFVPGRNPSFLDVIVDFVGAVTWTLSAYLISRRLYGIRQR